MGRLLTLNALIAALWCLLGNAAKIFGAPDALLLSGTAAALCLVPTVLVMAWADWSLGQSPDQKLVMVLGGTLMRMGTVLIGGWFLTMRFAAFRNIEAFAAWLVVFYLLTLLIEVVLILGAPPLPRSTGVRGQSL